MNDISETRDKSIFLASGSRSQAKAVYRMLANDKCTKEEILSSPREAVVVRSETETILLAVQDTMSVNYAGHEKTEGMGLNCEKTLGVNTHSCLSMSTEGIRRMNFVSRNTEKGAKAPGKITAHLEPKIPVHSATR